MDAGVGKRLMLLSVIFLSCVSFAFSVVPEVRVSPPKATVGDPIRIDFDFTLPPGCRIQCPALTAQAGEFSILESYPGPLIPGVQPPGGTQDQHYYVRLIVAAYKTGTFAFPALPFLIIDSDGKQTAAPSPEIQITIESILGAGDLMPKDLKKQAEIPEPFAWLLWTVLLLSALALAAAIWRWRKRRRPSPAAMFRGPQIDPLDVVEAEFRALIERGLLEKGMVKQFYVEISDIVKRGLEAGYRIPAVEQTTSEIMIALSLSAGPERERIEAFLLACDLVKFARYVPGEKESEQTVCDARELLTRCRGHREQVSGAPQPASEAAS
jgi:hypothetical protein